METKYTLSIVDWLKENKIKILLWIIFYFGISLGCFFLPSFGSSVSILSDNFVMGYDKISLFGAMISHEMGVMALLFFISLTFFGIIGIFFFIFLKGLGIGIILNSLYSIFSFKGIFFGIFIFLPGVFISSASLIFLSYESFKMSKITIKKMFFDLELNDYKNNIKSYSKKFIQSLCLSFLGSLITFGFHYFFSNFFNIRMF